MLAIAAPQRLKEFPNLPTLAEAGYPGVNLGGWGGLFLPAGTPAPIADKWTREVRRIVALPDVQQRIADMGFVAVGNSGQEFARDLASEIEKWGVVVRANNIKLD
ncbi:MAG TPA: tripartite tricarboxylate transporter substrate-binding protein [Burkholderiaceae bacterium]